MIVVVVMITNQNRKKDEHFIREEEKVMRRVPWHCLGFAVGECDATKWKKDERARERESLLFGRLFTVAADRLPGNKRWCVYMFWAQSPSPAFYLSP